MLFTNFVKIIHLDPILDYERNIILLKLVDILLKLTKNTIM